MAHSPLILQLLPGLGLIQKQQVRVTPAAPPPQHLSSPFLSGSCDAARPGGPRWGRFICLPSPWPFSCRLGAGCHHPSPCHLLRYVVKCTHSVSIMPVLFTAASSVTCKDHFRQLRSRVLPVPTPRPHLQALLVLGSKIMWPPQGLGLEPSSTSQQGLPPWVLRAP